MHRIIPALFLLLVPVIANAWNATGHRLVARIAWERISPPQQALITHSLKQHPDYSRWVDKAHTAIDSAIFAEASTWPDDIRNDPRFYTASYEPATPKTLGFPDMERHLKWHYMNLAPNGQVKSGEIDQQIIRLNEVLRSTRQNEQISYALPWLIHLIGDIHQPLHVGRYEDRGGSRVEIENPFNKRHPQTNLHVYWDSLGGPSGLRGKHLTKTAIRLLATYPAPKCGSVALWQAESHQLLPIAYPKTDGQSLPIVSQAFHRQANQIADQRIVAAGYRLACLLENAFQHRVSRETP